MQALPKLLERASRANLPSTGTAEIWGGQLTEYNKSVLTNVSIGLGPKEHLSFDPIPAKLNTDFHQVASVFGRPEGVDFSMTRSICGAFCLFWIWPPGIADSGSGSVIQSLNGQIDALGKISVPASVTLVNSGTPFSSYSGTLLVSNRVRTTLGGGGTITVQATADFQPSGGPSIASQTLTYICAGGSLGTPCSGTQTVSLTAQTPVLSIPGGACTGGGAPCSSSDPNTVQLSLAVSNDPAYRAAVYSAQVTFTISAL